MTFAATRASFRRSPRVPPRILQTARASAEPDPHPATESKWRAKRTTEIMNAFEGKRDPWEPGATGHSTADPARCERQAVTT